jgi:biopolymer transport protein TolR
MWSRPRLKDRVLARRRSAALMIMEFSAFATVAFALLSIAVYVTPRSHNQDPVDVPRSDHARWMPGAMRENALKVLVTRSGAVYLGHEAVTLGRLADGIRENLKRGSERRVYLRADARARYDDVGATLDAIRAAGIRDVSVITDQRQP